KSDGQIRTDFSGVPPSADSERCIATMQIVPGNGGPDTTSRPEENDHRLPPLQEHNRSSSRTGPTRLRHLQAGKPRGGAKWNFFRLHRRTVCVSLGCSFRFPVPTKRGLRSIDGIHTKSLGTDEPADHPVSGLCALTPVPDAPSAQADAAISPR